MGFKDKVGIFILCIYRYIYTDNVEIKPELAMPILYASKKYLLPGLTQVCVEYLEKQLSGENACILYDHSLLFDEPKLTERSLLMIKNKTKECLESSSMNYVRQSTLSKILDSDRLSTPEVDVFTACETWARYQVEQSGQEVTGEAMREVLGDCVFKIRYPNMKFKEFGTTVSPKGILLAEEELLMFRYFASEIEMSLPQNISSKNRYLPGPFTILTDANCAEMSISSCTTAYDITTDQTISINCVKLGDMKQGTDFYGKQVTVTCSQVKIDNTVFKVRAFHPGNPSVLYTDKSFNLYKDSKVTLQMTLNSGYTGSVSPSPKMKYVTSREMKMSDATTGLNVSVSSNNHMFLLGFTYDYNYL